MKTARPLLATAAILGAAAVVLPPTASAATHSKPTSTAVSIRGAQSHMPWQSGAFTMEDANLGNQFAQQRGAALDLWSTFSGSQNKTDESSMWMLDRIPKGFKGTRLSIGVPLWSRDSSAHDAATGGMDAVWTSIAEGLANRYPDSYIRLGWEMNLQGSNGGVATEANKDDWVKAFQRASKIFKKVQPRFQIVFNPNLGPASNANGDDGTPVASADELWPGDDHVDVVGVDAYDQWEPYTNDDNWNWHYAGDDGLNHWMQFSYQHNKLFALPEWGLSGYPNDQHHGGDNPRFINYMTTYLDANKNHIAYESYYDDFGSDIRSGMSPATNPYSMRAYTTWIAKDRTM